MRIPIIAGNWKMNMSIGEAIDFVNNLKGQATDTEVTQIICAPFTMLQDLKKIVAGTKIQIGAQNMHYEKNGAFTGEISAGMLVELGVDCVILGHSERRQYFGESNESVGKKVVAALANNLMPILCCGETLDQREKGLMEKVVEEQIRLGLEGVDENNIERVVIAYEPIWAIGTGKVATTAQAESAISYLRAEVTKMFSQEAAEKVRILYGGSVTPDNIAELMVQQNIDGALVGGASLKADSFLALLGYKK